MINDKTPPTIISIESLGYYIRCDAVIDYVLAGVMNDPIEFKRPIQHLVINYSSP